jgi:hypothetical protein
MIEGTVVVLLYAAIAAVALQVMDAVFSLADALTIRDTDEPDALTRRRFREIFWSVVVSAALAVLVAFGVDAGARLIWDDEQLYAGVGVLVASAIAAMIVGLIGAVAIARRERPTYARLRRDLRDRSTSALQAGELEEFEGRLDRADRVRARRPKAALALRLIGLVLVAVMAAFGAIVLFAAQDSTAWFYLAGAVVELVALGVAVRFSILKRERLEEVLEAQRVEVVAMLERARIPQRGSVPGLRDRVTRALAILREKQR